jgi:hypothetical protein
MTSILNFQQLLTACNVPENGSQVGGITNKQTNPLFAGALLPVAPASTERLFLVDGTSGSGVYQAGVDWPDAEFYPPGGIATDYAGGPLQATWNVLVSSQIAAIQATEFTLIWIDPNGYAYNGAFSIGPNGHILVSNFGQASWTDTGIDVGVLTPDVYHQLIVQYDFNPVTRTRSILSAAIDKKLYAIPATAGSSAATASTWARKIFMPQFQLGQTAAGGLIVARLNGCSITA